MTTYKNLSGKSSVRSFQATQKSIRVNFTDGTAYLYTIRSAGKDNLEYMKRAAAKGIGLNTFINSVTKNRYERQIK